jgi:predicted nucleic acid-binding protein
MIEEREAVFVDSSAFFAILAQDDPAHRPASDHMLELHRRDVWLLTTNYVVLETTALLQNRIGLRAALQFQTELLEPVEIHFVTPQQHRHSVEILMEAQRRKLSLVDCSSFCVMREFSLRKAFTFDQHFRDFGFECVPSLQS